MKIRQAVLVAPVVLSLASLTVGCTKEASAEATGDEAATEETAEAAEDHATEAEPEERAEAEMPKNAIAPLPPLSDDGREMLRDSGKSRASLAAEIPTAAEVGVPAYPGAYYTTTATMEMEGVEIVGVNLVSTDPPEKVTAWYREQLEPSWSFDETMDMFVADGKKFDFAKVTELTTVAILDEDGSALDMMVYELPAVKTRIQINRPRPAAKAD